MSQASHQRYDVKGIKKSSAKALETLTSSCCSAISSIKYHVDKSASYLLLYHITVNSSSSHILGMWYHSGQGHCLPVKGLFPLMGYIPNSQFLPKEVLNEDGFVKTNQSFETIIPGLYAVGDILERELKQIYLAESDANRLVKVLLGWKEFLLPKL